MRLGSSFAYIAAASALVACIDPGGCGGATCPFGEVAFAAVEGRVFKADGSPLINREVFIDIGPGMSIHNSPVDLAGRYRIEIDLISDPGAETVPAKVTVGWPVTIEENVTIRFARDRATRPTTIIDLHER